MSEPDVPSDVAERRARHVAVLRELAEIGMDIARALRGQAEADPKASAGADLAFARIARAVRLTLALETRMAEEGFAATQRLAAHQQSARERADFVERVRIGQRESTVHRLVAEAIEIEGQETERAEPDEVLLDALDEAMKGLDLSDDRCIGEIVATLCKDLGVTIDWTYCQDEHWAREERIHRPPGSPFAHGVPAAIWPDWSQYDPGQAPPLGEPAGSG
jgi:hypothetical protein